MDKRTAFAIALLALAGVIYYSDQNGTAAMLLVGLSIYVNGD